MIRMDFHQDNTSSADDAYDVLDIKKLPSIMSSYDESINDTSHEWGAQSVSAFMFLSQSESQMSFGFPASSSPEAEQNEEAGLNTERLSLAYERLHCMPKILLDDLAPKIKTLDISHNEFDNLDFLKHFKQLTSLICDRNNISSATRLPSLPHLELLWMNNCHISELHPWIDSLQEACPHLAYLSLMGNRAAPSMLNDGNFYEYLQYRLYVISLFPLLIHLDDSPVSNQQREDAKKVNRKTLVERIRAANKIPAYLRTVGELFASPPLMVGKERKIRMKNVVV